ncbi:MAG: hypothetical protein H6737_13850 [Alphaproteobacteria bacterium]|nr:hypothetical protein [Alphaproteobacteria bacterium]
MVIAAGAWRFGQTEEVSRWFHLGCASAGAPRAFAPFRAEAAAKLAAEPDREPASTRPRDREAERLLATSPDDPAARQVFIDKLLEAGDPWGEVLALYASGEDARARKLFKKHQADLTGGMAPKLFEWEDGFLVDALVESQSQAQLGEQLDRVFGLRTACVLRNLRIPIVPDEALIRQVSERAPASLRGLFSHLGPALDHLDRPGLDTLVFFVPARSVPPERLFSGVGVPDVRTLEMFSNNSPLSPEFLRSLLRSPLVARLSRLGLFQGALSSQGADVVLEEADRLDGIESVWFEVPNAQKGAIAKRFQGRLRGLGE